MYVRFTVFVLLVETFIVVWPLSGGPSVTPVGLKAMLTPDAAGEMLVVKFTRPLNPFAAVTVTVKVVYDPRETVRDPGVTARTKSGVGGAVGVADRSLDSAPVPALLIAATL